MSTVPYLENGRPDTLSGRGEMVSFSQEISLNKF